MQQAKWGEDTEPFFAFCTGDFHFVPTEVALVFPGGFAYDPRPFLRRGAAPAAIAAGMCRGGPADRQRQRSPSVKAFKPIFLTGAMALVTWGVWHTLTHSHSGSDASDDPTPKWGRDSANRGKGTGGPAGGPTHYESARHGNDPRGAGGNQETTVDPAGRENGALSGAGNAVIGPFDPAAAPPPNEGTRESTQPRFGAQAQPTTQGQPAAQPQPKEIATAPPMSLEAQRLNDQFDTA